MRLITQKDPQRDIEWLLDHARSHPAPTFIQTYVRTVTLLPRKADGLHLRFHRKIALRLDPAASRRKHLFGVPSPMKQDSNEFF